MNQDKSQGGNLLGAALAGAAVGAAAVYLSKEENRKKIREAIDGVKKDSQGALKKLQEKTTEVKEETQEKVSKGLEEASKKVKTRNGARRGTTTSRI